mgnify:CR=1 FL=1
MRGEQAEDSLGLFQIGPEGLPAREVSIRQWDIKAPEGIIHLLSGLPGAPSMTRGGLLEQKVCRQILESAVERSDIRHARGETESSVAIMEAVIMPFESLH